jgi:four helix bundle protein
MSEIHKIEDLRVWQNARVLCKIIYTLTHKEDFEKDFRFVQQIRAAAGSIMDNIAEGYGRGGNKEFIQFLSIAKGSTQEVLSQLYRAYDVQYITEQEFIETKQLLNTISVMLHNLIERLKQSDIKGSKYNKEQ